MIDFIWSFISAVGFTYPLRKFIKSLINDGNLESQNRIKHLIDVCTKYSVLTWVPTLIIILRPISFITFQQIDEKLYEEYGWVLRAGSAIGSCASYFCIVLMTKYYVKGYRVCFVADRCVKGCMSCCCGYRIYSQDEENLKKDVAASIAV